MKRLILLLLLAALPAPLFGATEPFDPFKMARIDEKPGAQIPLDARLLDQDGKPTSLRAIADGRPLLLVPVLHQCPNICGVTLAGIVDAAKGQKVASPGRDFRMVAFGIDPREGPQDATADLHRVASEAGDHSVPIVATTATAASILTVTDALGYHYAWDSRIGQYAHAAATAVLTPDGHLTRWLYGLSPDPAELGRAIADAQAGRTGGFVQQLILLCYHYDPQTGTYSLMIGKVLRYAALATVLLLAGLILLLRRRSA